MTALRSSSASSAFNFSTAFAINSSGAVSDISCTSGCFSIFAGLSVFSVSCTDGRTYSRKLSYRSRMRLSIFSRFSDNSRLPSSDIMQYPRLGEEISPAFSKYVFVQPTRLLNTVARLLGSRSDNSASVKERCSAIFSRMSAILCSYPSDKALRKSAYISSYFGTPIFISPPPKTRRLF